jgi:hypothetical protein
MPEAGSGALLGSQAPAGLTARKERHWRRYLAAVLFAHALPFLSAAPGHIAGTATAAAFVAVAHAAAA